MHGWTVQYDPSIDGKRHSLRLPHGHALLSPMVAQAFAELGITAAVWEHGMEWIPLNPAPSISAVEAAYGRYEDRARYNTMQLRLSRRQKKPVLGLHAGYFDWFAPVVHRSHVLGVLVAGPFAREHPSSATVLEQWRWLTGRHGHPDDPAFAEYLSLALSTPVLDGDKANAFGELIECLTQLMVASGDAAALANRAERLRVKLVSTRVVERTWDVVQRFIDSRFPFELQGPTTAADLGRLGLSRLPEDVLVAFAVDPTEQRDPVAGALHRHAFQRRSVEIARKARDTIAGRIGDHGVVVLSAGNGTKQRRRQRLNDLSASLADSARREFGLTLRFGLSLRSGSTPLPRVYQAAASGAEAALMTDQRVIIMESIAAPDLSLWQIRRDLSKATEQGAQALSARFDRYLEAVARRSAYRLDAARGEIQAGFERIAEPLLDTGSLDPRSFDALMASLDRAANTARTLRDLTSAYRQAVADIVDTVQQPVRARQDRTLRRALEYVQHHYAEPLSSAKVARIAGFARPYFSRLFKEREGITFEAYLKGLRLGRAKQLLTTTNLSVTRVAELSGFGSPQYLARVLRKESGESPLCYREQHKLYELKG